MKREKKNIYKKNMSNVEIRLSTKSLILFSKIINNPGY